MFSCLIFLNELSYVNGSNKTPAEVTQNLLATIKALRAAKKIRADLLLAGNVPVSKITLAEGTHSLASLLGGDAYKDEWRFIKSLDQSSPGDSSWNFTKPPDLCDVRFGRQQTFGLLWAHANQSLVISIALATAWKENEISAQLETLNDEGDLISSNITVPNVSTSQHVDDHRQLISRFGRDEASSSVVYQGNDFIARIYFFDHNPPHFHVCSVALPGTTLARFNIQTLEVLDGILPSGMERTVRRWGQMRNQQLMENWTRCSQGQPPFAIHD